MDISDHSSFCLLWKFVFFLDHCLFRSFYLEEIVFNQRILQFSFPVVKTSMKQIVFYWFCWRSLVFGANCGIESRINWLGSPAFGKDRRPEKDCRDRVIFECFTRGRGSMTYIVTCLSDCIDSYVWNALSLLFIWKRGISIVWQEKFGLNGNSVSVSRTDTIPKYMRDTRLCKEENCE